MFEPWRAILAVARLVERHGVQGLEARMRGLIGERAWGPDQADTARIETNLGDLLAKREKLQESEQLFRAALDSREKILGVTTPKFSTAKQSSAAFWFGKAVFRRRDRFSPLAENRHCPESIAGCS
jgi:hypothetical protein